MTSLLLNTQNSTPFNTTFITTNNTAISMSSLEIADLVQARHDSVKRTIERLVESGVIQCPPLVDIKNHQNRDMQVYVFESEQGKRDTTIIVAQLSPTFLGTVVDRWMELEKQYALAFRPSYMIEDPVARAKKWIEEETAKQVIETKLVEAAKVIEVQAPKAEVFDAVLDRKRTYTIREFSQRTGVKEKTVKQWIADKRWVTGSDAKSYRPAAWSNTFNFMRMVRTGKPFTNQYGNACYNEVIAFTQEGFNEAVRKMVKSGLMQPIAEIVQA